MGEIPSEDWDEIGNAFQGLKVMGGEKRGKSAADRRDKNPLKRATDV